MKGSLAHRRPSRRDTITTERPKKPFLRWLPGVGKWDEQNAERPAQKRRAGERQPQAMVLESWDRDRETDQQQHQRYPRAQRDKARHQLLDRFPNHQTTVMPDPWVGKPIGAAYR